MDEEFKMNLLENCDLDIDARTLYIFKEIDADVALKVTKYLNYLDKTKGEIKIVINCPGGSIPDGMAIVDCISKLSNPTVGYVPGAAASMAVDVLMVCNKRVMSKQASLLIHSGSAELSGNIKDVEKQATAFTRELELTTDSWLKRLKIKKPKLKELLSTDTFLYSKEALKYGFVDEIW